MVPRWINDDGLAAAGGVGVVQVESFGLVEVELDGGDAFLVSGGVADLDVEFRAVDSGLPRRLDERQVFAGVGENLCGSVS